MGILAVLRSKSLSGKVIGLMITASHNPEEDNGVKLVDPLGEMLEASWEETATDLVNSTDLRSATEKIVSQKNIDWNTLATVFIGRDTRWVFPCMGDLTKIGDLLVYCTRECVFLVTR